MQAQLASGEPPHCVTYVNFNVSKTLEQPVYMYYKLENFYQNHRRYAMSRDDSQLAGNDFSYSDLSDCEPFAYYGEFQGISSNKSASQLYCPCGLIAWSMFNDSFVLSNENQVICNGTNPDGIQCTKQGIAWKSDVEKKFKAFSNPHKYYQYPLEYYGETGHKLPNVTDEDFMVWMRTASLPTFRKLYRKINVDLVPGELYTLTITQNYPVYSFNGKKYVVFSTSTWVGGKNEFLGGAYVAVGSICFFLALIFLLKHLVSPRSPGELGFLANDASHK